MFILGGNLQDFRSLLSLDTTLNSRSTLQRHGTFKYVSKLGKSSVDTVWVNNIFLPDVNNFFVDGDYFLSDYFSVNLVLNFESNEVKNNIQNLKKLIQKNFIFKL